MDNRVLSRLEYDKIIEKLTSLTSTAIGREKAEILRPGAEINEIALRLKDTDDGVACIVKKGIPPLGGVKDIRPSIKRLEMGAVLGPGELLSIADILRVSRSMQSFSKEKSDVPDNNIINSMSAQLVTSRTLENNIYTSIIGDNEISDDASITLRNIRKSMEDIQYSIKDKLESIIRSSRNKKYIQDFLVTLREDRYVIPVKQEYKNEIPGMVHDSSASGATLFIEPMAVVDANNKIKQLKIKERVEIERILRELSNEAALILDGLRIDLEVLGKIDFIFAKARLSLEYNCASPALNDKGIIIIKKGRHPLLHKDEVVPVDFWIGNDFKTLVITGPNTGGKTVTLKTVGLFVLMVQSGLHIPASDGTEICVYDTIFADIGDEQSIEQSLSTFSSHMTNMVGILENAGHKSLVLLDELGAGTDPTEGAALAMAVIENLYGRGCTTVATTHYSELKVYALTTDGIENGSCEFDVSTLRPTYRLLIGVPGKSNAFAISKRLGLDNEILNRAGEFLTQEDVKFEDVMTTIEKNRTEIEEERIEAKKHRQEIDKIKKRWEDEKSRVEKRKDKMLREAGEQARRIILDARDEAGKVIKELRKLKGEADQREVNKRAEELRLKIKEKSDEIEKGLAHNSKAKGKGKISVNQIKKGDDVLIIDINQKGTVVKPPDINGEALIQAGIMKINVHISNLEPVEEKGGRAVIAGGTGKIGRAKVENISVETDVRGMTVDEACAIIDKYLDDASLSGLKEITIIHGKGTGALRSGIQGFLKINKHVSSFRLGSFGEGDSGVTVVKIK